MENVEKNGALRLSQWAHLFQKKELMFFAVYHSLNVEVVFLENKFLQMFECFKIGTTINSLIKRFKLISKEEIEDVCQELTRIGIIIPVSQDDRDILARKQEEYVHSPGLETLYLIVTDDCNLRCKYCFINNNMPVDYKCSVMSWEIAKVAVDMYFNNLSKNPPEYENFFKTIFFYGGEPLLNFPLIKRIVEYTELEYKKELSEMGNLFRFSMVTNGVAITKEIAEFFGQHTNISIAISLDGNKKSHDKKRVFENGSGTFDHVINGYELLKNVGNRENVAISCTIDTHNIDYLQDLLELQKVHGFLAINLNPLLDTEQRFISKSYMVKASKRMLEYFELAREKGIYEDRIMRKVKAFMEKRIHPFDCQATGSQIVCAPNGQLGVCHEGIGAKSFFFDKVSRDFKFHDNTTIKEWKKRTPLNIPQCWNCSAIGICGGGCTYGAWLRNGSIWSVDDRFCVHSLMTLEWLIWDLYKKI